MIGVADTRLVGLLGPADVRTALESAGAGALLLADCNLGPDALREALAAGRAGHRVAVDAVSTAKVTRLPADLGGLDLLFCNRDEARAWLAHHRMPTPAGDPGLAAAMHAAGAAGVVLGSGPDGVSPARSGRRVGDPGGAGPGGRRHRRRRRPGRRGAGRPSPAAGPCRSVRRAVAGAGPGDRAGSGPTEPALVDSVVGRWNG